MGIASQDLDGDGYPGDLPDQPGRQQARRPSPMDRRNPATRHRRRATAAAAQRTVRGRVTRCRPRPGMRSSRTSTTTASWTCSSPRATSRRCPTTPSRDPNNLLIGQRRRHVHRGAEAAGIVNFARARGAALADLNLDGLLDLVVVNRRENVRLWRNVGAGTAEAPAPMGHWLAVQLDDQDGAEPRRHRRLGRGPRRRPRRSSREVTVGGGHAGGQLGWIHFGLGAADRADGPGHVAGRRGRARGMPATADRS